LLKKLLLICALLTFFLGGCSTAADKSTPTDQLQQENDQLKHAVQGQREKIASLQKENDTLRKTRVIRGPEIKSDILVQNVEITSKQAYTSGKNTGAVYGTFNVAATLKNVSNKNYNNVKLVTIFQRTRTNYPQAKPRLESAVYTIPTLKAGQRANITFRGFKADHPEMIQEVIVNPVTFNDISKARVRAAFAPGSRD